jgi:hypothetical protein
VQPCRLSLYVYPPIIPPWRYLLPLSSPFLRDRPPQVLASQGTEPELHWNLTAPWTREVATSNMDMQANDDLAALFSRNLTLQQQPPQPQAQPTSLASTEEPQLQHETQLRRESEEAQPQAELEPIKYSITQHYQPSAYIYRDDNPPPAVDLPRRSSEPPQTQQPSAELLLAQHGVDARLLSAPQMELFKAAESSQQLRLVELWRICPPANPQENPAVALQTTTIEQEEFLARLRYQRNFEENEQRMNMESTPLTPVQTGDGHWVTTAYVEPYMASGYEELARREYEESVKQQQYHDATSRPKEVFYSHFGAAVGGPEYRPATDPVYGTNEWARQQQAMENQYGTYQQMEL